MAAVAVAMVVTTAYRRAGRSSKSWRGCSYKVTSTRFGSKDTAPPTQAYLSPACCTRFLRLVCVLRCNFGG